MALLKDTTVTGNLRVTGNTFVNDIKIFSSLSAKSVLAAPSDSNGAPSWRILTAADVGAAESGHNHNSVYVPLNGTNAMTGDLSFSHTQLSVDGHITWSGGSYLQRITIKDNATNNDATFIFLLSKNSGTDYTDLFTINDNGTVTATTFSGNLSGTASRATADADGNTITTTYAPLASPSFTGTPKSITPSSNSDGTMIATKAYVDGILAANDALVYKGTQDGANSETNGGTLLPEGIQGDTYKVSTAGYINGVYCELGDMIICVTDVDASTTDNYSTTITSWNIIQTSDGTVSTSETSVTENTIPRYIGTTGRFIQSSSASINDNGVLSITTNRGANLSDLNITSSWSANSGYLWGVNHLVPNITAGANTCLLTGVANSTGNQAVFGFHYNGDNNNGSYAEIGLYGNNGLLKVYKNGNVSIGGTNNSYKLHVNGSTYINGTTYVNGTLYGYGRYVILNANYTNDIYLDASSAGGARALGASETTTYTGIAGDPWIRMYFFAPRKTLTYATAGDDTSECTTTLNKRCFTEFRLFSYNNSTLARLSYYEAYQLPSVSAGKTANTTYSILTTKQWAWNRTSAGTYINTLSNDTNAGIWKMEVRGTTSAEGWNTLLLGNDKKSNVAENASGRILLYNSNGTYSNISGKYGQLDGTNNVNYIELGYVSATQIFSYFIGDIAGNASTATQASVVGKGTHTAAVTANEFDLPTGTLTIVGNVSNTTMTHTNNANAEIIIKAHPTSGNNYYESRLGFSGNGSLYFMPVNSTTWYRVLNNNNTYAANSDGSTISVDRNTETTIATINGVAVKIKTPASDNTWRPIGTGATDAMAGNTVVTNVNQSAVTNNAKWHKILLHYTADDVASSAVTTVNNVVYADANMSFLPSTGTFTSTVLNVARAISLEYNSTDLSLDFVFI